MQCVGDQSVSCVAVELYLYSPIHLNGVVLNYAEGHLPCCVTVRMCEEVDWIYLAYNGLQCQAVVNVVMNTEVLAKAS